MPLTDLKIRTTKPSDKPIRLSDGGWLYLEVRPSGAKLWRFRYRLAGKENVYAIGQYFSNKREGHVSLEDARKERDRARALVKRGVHPSHQRQSDKQAIHCESANTFESVAREWIAKKKPAWTLDYLRRVERLMEVDVFPKIGKHPIRNVTAAQLLGIVKAIEARGATSALRVRQLASAIFGYAVVTLRADADPAAALKGAVHRPKVEHHKPLSRDQIKAFVRTLSVYGGQPSTVIAFRLMLLTFVRTVELRGARWGEIDLDRAQWRIPAERMKMREPHIVPLARQAMGLLKELHLHTGQSEMLFPNFRNPKTFMSARTLNTALTRMGFSGKDTIGFSAHGFRATASTILNEAGFRPDVIERQLAHTERNQVRASYNQAQYLEERRTMMQQWADMIDEIGSQACI